MRKSLVFGILLLAAASGLQAQTNQGTDFWLAETANLGCRSDFGISIANPNAVPANAVIDNVIGGPLAIVIAPGSLETRTFPCRATCQSFSGTNRGKNMVYHVTSDVDVVVYTFNPLANAFTNDASLILPVPALGKNYRIGDYVNPLGNTRGSQFGVVAVEDSTNIQTFNTTGALVDNIVINQGEYFARTNGSCSGSDPVSTDVTGWSVVTDKPAAVFTGSVCTSLGSSTSACDHLDEQVIPQEALASTYVSCPSLTRPVGCDPAVPGSCSPDLFRYVATEDATTVSSAPAVVGGVINTGEYLQVQTSTPHIVSADKPIYGYQYLISQNSGSPVAGTGDPALFGIPPVEQFQFSYIFLTPSTYNFDFINVVAPVGTNLSLDGASLADTCRPVGFIGGTEYCCLGKPVSDGVHTLTGDQQFGLSVTGFDSYASYAYIGGVGVQPINAGCDTGGPYQEISCDVPLDVQLDGTPSCLDGSTPTVAWSSTQGVTYDDPTIEDPVATVPDFGTFEICMNVTCGTEDPVQCCSTIEVIEQLVGCNEPPVALCTDVTVNTDPGLCTADASIDNGSYDPDGDPITLEQAPPGPYELGDTLVTLTVTDDGGLSDSCEGTVTVIDEEPPVVSCNSPATIVPPDAPISFTATATDNCGTDLVTIDAYDCWHINGAGKRKSKLESCVVSLAGDTVTIGDSGGVGTFIDWWVTATDTSGNETTTMCTVEVVNPGGGS